MYVFFFLLILTTIQLINNAMNRWLYKGTQTSHVPSGIRTHNPSTCPGHGSHQTASAITHSANMTMKNSILPNYRT